MSFLFIFSLQRCDSLSEGQTVFNRLRDKIPALLEMDRSLLNQSYLQSFCDTLRKNPSFNILHLIVYFDLKNAVSHSDALKYMNIADISGLTPVMLAVQRENLNMVKFLVAKGASLIAVDAEKNSVFHFAAKTNSDLVEVCN